MPSEAQIAGGHKANLSNPNTSTESKMHSKEILQAEFGIKGEYCFLPPSSLEMAGDLILDKFPISSMEKTQPMWREA